MNIDYSKVCEGYGMKTFQITNLEQIPEVLKAAQASKTSTLIEIKVLPKTMTKNYGGWWHVGVPEVSKHIEVEQESSKNMKELENIRKY